jgi:hypothetical protein
MRVAGAIVLAITLMGCREPVPPESVPKKSPVVLSVEYPNAAGGGIPSETTIHIRNESKGTIKALPDFYQAMAMGWFKIAVRDAEGKLLKQLHPFIGGPPDAPEEKDYLVLKPSEAGRLRFLPGVVVKGYDLKPGQLYFFELTLKIDGVEGTVTLVTPFGYSESRNR